MIKSFSNFVNESNQFINEKFINWFPSKDTDNKFQDEYADDLKKMIDLSYAEIGGYLNGNFDIQKDVIDDCELIKIYKSGGVACAFRIYKDKHGRKAICSGTNGTPDGKKGLYFIFQEDVKFMRTWSEVNSKLEYIFCTKFGAERVPNDMVPELLKKDVEKLEDGFHYKRKIGDKVCTKCIITGSTDKLIKKLKEVDEVNGDFRLNTILL